LANAGELLEREAERPGERDRGRTRVASEASMPSARRGRWLVVGLVGCVVALIGVSALSLALGAKRIPLSVVVEALTRHDANDADHVVVLSLRATRTVVGLLVGLALGLAGTLMQGVTRNPLADPGLLGVSAGAAFGIVVALGVFGVTAIDGYLWFAFGGAAIGGLVVYAIGSIGRDGATPVKLALAGAAIGALLASVTTLLLLRDLDTYAVFQRIWLVGSISGRDGGVVLAVLPFIVGGSAIALVSGRWLNAMSLGDDVARSLGQRLGLARSACAASVVLLAGAATAAAGPIAFIGLAVPHLARLVVGADYRWILAYSAVLAPMLLLIADIAGRVVARPGEIGVGVMTALIGAPFFIALIRRRKVAEL
jgi:iron complex transport system permease protein